MEADDLKKWMERNRKNEIDVASATKVHPRTVARFLDGKNVQPVVLAAFERLVRETEERPPPDQAA